MTPNDPQDDPKRPAKTTKLLLEQVQLEKLQLAQLQLQKLQLEHYDKHLNNLQLKSFNFKTCNLQRDEAKVRQRQDKHKTRQRQNEGAKGEGGDAAQLTVYRRCQVETDADIKWDDKK